MEFLSIYSGLDEQNILKINEYSNEWFKQKFPSDVIDDFYHSNIKVKKSNVAPVIKFRVKTTDIKIQTNNNQTIKLSDLNTNNCELILNLKFSGLKFLRQQVFCQWEIKDIVIFYNLTIFK